MLLCNNAKANEYTLKEFESIARGINQVEIVTWEEKLKIDFKLKLINNNQM